MTWTAILVACLISSPSSCREHQMILQAVMPVAAFVEAQSLAAVWLAERPELQQRTLVIRPGRES